MINTTPSRHASSLKEEDVNNIPEITMSGKHYRKSDYKLLIIRMIFRIMNKVEEQALNSYDKIKSKLKFERKFPSLRIPMIKYFRKIRVVNVLRFIWRLPLVIMYWLYIAPMMYITTYLWINAITPIIKIICKKSELATSMLEHVVALIAILDRVKTKLATERPSELVRFFITTMQEVI